MPLVKHELWRERWALAVWTVSIGTLMAICIFLYPEMKDEMDGIPSCVYGLLRTRVRQIEPALQQIHPQYQFQVNRRTAMLTVGVVWKRRLS